MELRWLGRAGRWLVGLVALVACLVWPRAGRAEEKARLVYVRGAGADDCPAEVDLRLWVIARLGYDPFSPQASRVVIARVEAVDHQLHGSVEVVDQQGLSTGRRELSSKTELCQELARAMALSISLAIDPERATSGASKPVSDQDAAPSQAARAAPSEPDQPRAAPATAPPPRFFAGVAFASNAGSLPAPALGGSVALGVWLRPFSIALEGHALQSFAADIEPNGRLTGFLLGSGLAGCGHLGRFALCLVGQVALQRLSASEVTDPHASSGLYLGMGPRLGWELPLAQHWALSLELEGLVNLLRNSAQLTGREVWKAPTWGGTLAIGVTTHFL